MMVFRIILGFKTIKVLYNIMCRDKGIFPDNICMLTFVEKYIGAWKINLNKLLM